VSAAFLTSVRKARSRSSAFMAARIGFEIADVAVDFGLRAGEHHVHVARPVRQRPAQRFRATVSPCTTTANRRRRDGRDRASRPVQGLGLCCRLAVG
jgi:hypothetical protein